MLPYRINFVLFLGLNSNKFYDNNVSSKGTVIFCSTELSDIWKLTQYIMYNIEIHKVLNGPKILKTIPSFPLLCNWKGIILENNKDKL